MNNIPRSIPYYELNDRVLKIVIESAARRNWKIQLVGKPQIVTEPPEGKQGRYIDYKETYQISNGDNVLYLLILSAHDEHTKQERGLDHYQSLLLSGDGLTTLIQSEHFYTTPRPSEDDIDEGRNYPSGMETKLNADDELAREIFDKVKSKYESQQRDQLLRQPCRLSA
jgi:hypothetical protein